jgi:Tfp pilus assembly protein PilO
MAPCNRKQLAIIAGAAVMVAVFFGGLYLPMARKLSSIRNEQRQYGLEAAQLSANATNLPALSDQLVAIKTKVGDFSARIPKGRQLGEFMQSVASLMNESDLRNQLVQPGEAVKSKDIHCIPVDIKCEGTLSQVFRFLRSLEDIDRRIRFENVELTTDRTFGGAVNLHARVYIYYKDDSEAAI